jgi:tRNA(Ile)-lysidine synthase
VHSLQKRFQDYIHSNHLLEKGEKVLLAVSGGLDSMVMAQLFVEEGIEISLAHCNFGLRGDESDGDEAFVMRWADSHQINCFVKSFDLAGGSTQLEARNVRYQWFDELLKEHKLGKIATAHHLNDSLETVLINLSRGTGIKGLTGISIQNDHIVRPLLFATKEELHTYAMDVGLKWREDSSNQKMDYDRNLIRHEVVPELMKLNPSLLRTFRLTSERIDHASTIVSLKVKEISNQYLIEESGGWRLDLDWVSNGSDELVLAELLSPFGVNYVTAKEIFAVRGKSGKSFPVDNWLITMDRSTIFIDSNKLLEFQELVIDAVGSYELGENCFEISKIEKEDVEFSSNNVAFFDAKTLDFPLKVRPWVEGDKFQPMGMKGNKKVSDFLIDEKIPVSKKKKVLVLESNRNIAWVIGHRIGDPFKITDHSKAVLKITFN